jgi:site-specific DNA-methyltransferase (adenine-specific)
MGTEIVGESKSVEYSTPFKIVEPLINEFEITTDVCASELNHKLPKYWNKEDNALTKEWVGNCWMNPPFSRDLRHWVKKAHNEAFKNGGTKVCLIPVRSNTKWWADIINDAEIRFINGEVNFNNEPRGLWLPMCIVIFGEKAKVGTFSVLNYR